MPTSNPFDPTQSTDPVIDDLVGSAYADVKQVAQALPEIRHVSSNLEAIYNVSLYSSDITELLANMDAIIYISENVDDLNAITENIVELAALGANVDAILEAAPNALASELKAEQWAQNPFNTPVEIGQYSALHHATAAASSASTATTKAAEALASADDAADSAALITGASWVMQLGAEPDGSRIVLKIIGYIGGIGTPPTANVGDYLKDDGTYTSTIAEAANVRGPSGPGSGDMLSTANLSDLTDYPTAFDTIKQPATDTYAGVAEIASEAETIAGVDAVRYITPALLRKMIPLGVMWDYTAGEEVLPGFLFPYGQAVSRTTYAAYFAKVGTTYGAGNGTTTFNLPNACGRATFGKDNMGGVSFNRLTGLSGGINGDTLGGVGGAETHALVSGENGPHTHALDIQGSRHGANGSTSITTLWGANGDQIDGDNLSHTTLSSGSGTAHNNVPPGIILNKILFVGA